MRSQIFGLTEGGDLGQRGLPQGRAFHSGDPPSLRGADGGQVVALGEQPPPPLGLADEGGEQVGVDRGRVTGLGTSDTCVRQQEPCAQMLETQQQWTRLTR